MLEQKEEQDKKDTLRNFSDRRYLAHRLGLEKSSIKFGQEVDDSSEKEESHSIQLGVETLKALIRTGALLSLSSLLKNLSGEQQENGKGKYSFRFLTMMLDLDEFNIDADELEEGDRQKSDAFGDPLMLKPWPKS